MRKELRELDDRISDGVVDIAKEKTFSVEDKVEYLKDLIADIEDLVRIVSRVFFLRFSFSLVDFNVSLSALLLTRPSPLFPLLTHLPQFHGSTASTTYRLRVFSYLIGPEHGVVLPPHRIALHGYNSSSPASSSSSDISVASEIAVVETPLVDPHVKEIEDFLILVGLLRPAHEIRPRTSRWEQQ